MSITSDFLIENNCLTKYSGCDKDIVIPTGVTAIGSHAFKGRESLTSVTIPEGVTSIGAGAFFDCRSLKSITIPESVTYIGCEAFLDCVSLTSITLPKSVSYSHVFHCRNDLTGG
ncbi:MAG: leucine-rich repeat domain-containing protein [Oscillospiraceae bacterium]|nr:leucine-rich repeat domain-containing protein [Oscillospiraceae bacterium]